MFVHNILRVYGIYIVSDEFYQKMKHINITNIPRTNCKENDYQLFLLMVIMTLILMVI